MSYQHDWSKDGERCAKCGDKDWMGGPCSVPDKPKSFMQRAIVCSGEPDEAPASAATILKKRYGATEERLAEARAELNAEDGEPTYCEHSGVALDAGPEQKRDAAAEDYAGKPEECPNAYNGFKAGWSARDAEVEELQEQFKDARKAAEYHSKEIAVRGEMIKRLERELAEAYEGNAALVEDVQGLCADLHAVETERDSYKAGEEKWRSNMGVDERIYADVVIERDKLTAELKAAQKSDEIEHDAHDLTLSSYMRVVAERDEWRVQAVKAAQEQVGWVEQAERLAEALKWACNRFLEEPSDNPVVGLWDMHESLQIELSKFEAFKAKEQR